MSTDDSPPHGLPRLLAILILLGIFLYIAWEVFRPKYVFLIRIKPQGLQVKRGILRREFLDQIQDLQKHTGLSRGSIRGHQHGKLVRLSFSPGFPDDCKQRVRNLWAIYK